MSPRNWITCCASIFLCNTCEVWNLFVHLVHCNSSETVNVGCNKCRKQLLTKTTGSSLDEGASLMQWPLLFTDDQSFTFDVHYISLTYTALTGARSLTQMVRSVRQGTSPQYQECYLDLDIWYWYRYLSAQPIISNSEAAMLSSQEPDLHVKFSGFQNFWHEITLYSIDISKKRFRTAFLTL